jgi:hypothetical protein
MLKTGMMLSAGMALAASANAQEPNKLLKAMSDYMAAQTAISFDFDTNLEVVTRDHQKILLASSGAVVLKRPDKIRMTRVGGFANAEVIFDGKTLTVVGKNANEYAQVEIPGTLDHLVDALSRLSCARSLKYRRHLECLNNVLTPGTIEALCEGLAVRRSRVNPQIIASHRHHAWPAIGCP